MNNWFILALISAVMAVGSFIWLNNQKNNSNLQPLTKTIVGMSWKILSGVTLLSLIFSMFVVVAPRTVGVEVQFGKAVRPLDNGIHFKSPLSKVHKLNGAVDNRAYNSGGEDAEELKVRLNNDAVAYPVVAIEFELKKDNGVALWESYKTYENIIFNKIEKPLAEVANDVIGKYDPLGKDAVKLSANEESRLVAMRQDILEQMKVKAGSDFNVRAVTLPIINYDEDTQNRINALQNEIGNTRIAEQKAKTAEAESRANKIMSGSLDEHTLTSKCLDIIAESGQSPIGCFPGTNVTPYKNVDAPQG